LIVPGAAPMTDDWLTGPGSPIALQAEIGMKEATRQAARVTRTGYRRPIARLAERCVKTTASSHFLEA
jgi:hypothetical protein